MRSTRLGTTLAAAGLAAVSAVALAGPAAASAPTPPSPLVAAKAHALRSIDGQRFQLAVANWRIASDRAAAADRTALATPVRSDLTALTTLRSAVAQDATVDAVTATNASVAALHVTDFVLPQVSAVLASDDITAFANGLAGDESRYSAAIATASAAGKNVTAANTALTDYTAKVAAAKTAATAAHESVLPLTVGGFPANAASLTAVRASLRSADADLGAALRDVRALRQVRPGR